MFVLDKRHCSEFGIITCFLWIKGTVLSLVLLRVFLCIKATVLSLVLLQVFLDKRHLSQFFIITFFCGQKALA